MSSDTRLLPRNNLRSTGIPRTTTAVNRPIVGGQGGSGITASPGADRATQSHVKKANEGRVPGVFMPNGAAPAPAPAATTRDTTSDANVARAASPMFDEQETALVAFLLDGFLAGELTPEQRALAQGAMNTLAAMMGRELAAQRMRAAQAGEAPPPITIDLTDPPASTDATSTP